MFSERLKEVRTERGYTLKALGAKVSLAESTMSLYESGNREPGFAILCKLSVILGVTTDYLLGRADTQNAEQFTEQSIIGHATTKGETRLLLSFRELNGGGQKKLFAYMDDLLKNDLNKKK